jgi:hypothetical protein
MKLTTWSQYLCVALVATAAVWSELSPAGAAPSALGATAPSRRVYYVGVGQGVPQAIARGRLGMEQVGIGWPQGSTSTTQTTVFCSVDSGTSTANCSTAGMSVGSTGPSCSASVANHGAQVFLCTARITPGTDTSLWCSALPPASGEGTQCSVGDGSTRLACSAMALPEGAGGAQCSVFGPPAGPNTLSYCSAQGTTNRCSSFGLAPGNGGGLRCSALSGSGSGSFCSVPAGSGATCTTQPGSNGFCSTDANSGAQGQCSTMTTYIPPGGGTPSPVNGAWPVGAAGSGLTFTPPGANGLCGP